MPENSTRFGLSEPTIRKITTVFAAHPDIEAVILYGSRAKGNYRSGSDIDLTLKGGTLTSAQLLKIENELDDLLLPYKIDLSLVRQIDNPALIDHINRAGVLFYAREPSDSPAT